MKSFTLSQFRAWGRKGGKKSKRKLSSAEAKQMSVKGVAARELKRKVKIVQNNP